MGMRITQSNMQLLVEGLESLEEVKDAAQDWLDAKEDASDRDAISDARQQLEASLEGAEGYISDLWSLLPRQKSK